MSLLDCLPFEASPDLLDVPVDMIKRGHYQNRRMFPSNSLEELAESLKETKGPVTPIHLRYCNDGQYELLAGERRWRACQLASIDTIRSLVGHYTDEEAAIISIIDNLQRENLSLLEEAEGYQQLMEEFSWTQETLSKKVNKSRSVIANAVRLLKLPDEIKGWLIAGKLEDSHARALVAIKDKIVQRKFAVLTIQKKWTVRDLERAVKNKDTTSNKPSTKKDNDIVRLENTVSEQCGYPVSISHGSDGVGYIQFKYFDLEQLDGILSRLGLKTE